jgi:hypothetical protein
MRKIAPQYYLAEDGEFVIENYNLARPFASFLPGIAGKYGIPLWAFYTNRGQGISSFGSKDKDNAILEFYPANKAWQLASVYGFRSFLKLARGGKSVFYEPFSLAAQGFKVRNRMRVSSSGLAIEEENPSLGINIEVKYFTVPNQGFCGLARAVSLKNTSAQPLGIELLDGLPQITPFGMNSWLLKEMSRTIEAWMRVENLAKNAPFYKLAVDSSDRPEVVRIKEGNFYLGVREAKRPRLVPVIVDPQEAFGPVTDFSSPFAFLQEKQFRPSKNPRCEGFTPCAFLFLDFNLGAGKEEKFYGLSGRARSKEELNSILPRVTRPGYFPRKEKENRELIFSLQKDIATQSSCREFDLYCQQTYLDNILRGGYPLLLSPQKNPKVFYLYSRKHGDPERDYNRFLLEPAYFSQGNGNYRDAIQNRRSDHWFNPLVKEENIVSFLNLIQTDGFNPLVVKGASFALKDKRGLLTELKKLCGAKGARKILSFLGKPFTPGGVALFLRDEKIKLICGEEDFLGLLISRCEKQAEAEHGEGFWSDHWAYNLDLLESYLGLFPEEKEALLFQNKEFSFYENSHTVNPRAKKYLLAGGQPRQLCAVSEDKEKKELLARRPRAAYRTTLLNKLLCLLANKLSSLDPAGVGIEMEAGKPNWYDALNGLPALFGSSICETFELKRLILFLRDALRQHAQPKVSVNAEIWEFLRKLERIIQADGFAYWDKSASIKEEYRRKARLGLSAKEILAPRIALLKFLGQALAKADQGLRKALDKRSGVYNSYFINQPIKYKTLKHGLIRPLKFRQEKLPLFLEGQVHALRLCPNRAEAKRLYQAARRSRLFDRKLKMYKVTAPLSAMTEEIGRCRVFPPGWLENETVWLHMQYKYLLELLKRGLYEEFYADFKNCLVPFQPPERYGRSILENSSFIVSSAHCDKELRGAGFVARLSGATAEFLDIWRRMNIGNNPFSLNRQGQLNLTFSPALAGWLFKPDGTYSFNFLSAIKVTYHNPRRKNTFGKNCAVVQRIYFRDANGSPVTISGATIPSPYAQQAREQQIKTIEIFL